MECKGNSEIKYVQGRKCINRNIMECKGIYISMRLKNHVVLIETLWNVKNNFIGNQVTGVKRINRNIMECKVI